MICPPNFRGIAPNRPFLTTRDIVEPHNMRLNHIESRFHAKFYVSQLFRKRNLIGYFKNLIGNIYEETNLSHFSHNLLTNFCLIYGFVSFGWLMVDFYNFRKFGPTGGQVNYLVNFRILACFWPFLTKTVITWDFLFRSELVNIRWKANRHSYGLRGLEIF